MPPVPADVFATIAAATDLAIPAQWQVPVAIVGAGGIVVSSHLPAYRAAGIQVAGIFDANSARATEVATRFEVAQTYPTLAAVLADEAVRVVDIAVPASVQPEIVSAALRAGKHVLSQKPLALDVPTAHRLVAEATAADRTLAVNQQLRFADIIAAPAGMVAAGLIGQPTVLTIQIRSMSTWAEWPWLAEVDRLDLLNHTIHYVDAARFLLGDPSAAYCAAGRRPGQGVRGETMTTSVLTYPDARRAVIDVNSQSLPNDAVAQVRLEGSEGAIRVSVPTDAAPDAVQVWSRQLGEQWLSYPVRTTWFPDAFVGPMRSVLQAIATGSVPATSARDNVRTVELIDALYRSIQTNQVQSLT